VLFSVAIYGVCIDGWALKDECMIEFETLM
jgi:hypothetical protein